MRKSIFILSVLLVFYSCNNSRAHKNVIPQEKYQKMMTELIIASKIKEQITDKRLNGLDPVQLVYQKYDVDSAQVKKSTDYYSHYPEILLEVYKKAKEELQKTLDSLEKSTTKMKKKKVDSIKNLKIKIPKKKLREQIKESE